MPESFTGSIFTVSDTVMPRSSMWALLNIALLWVEVELVPILLRLDHWLVLSLCNFFYLLTGFLKLEDLKPQDWAAYVLLKTQDKIDQPENAMLLRADIHNYFDNHQIGIDVRIIMPASHIQYNDD
jgi:HNH endonuclease